MAGILHDQNLEKQMGCMTGFLQLFDRHQILAGKRLYAPKRLPPSPAVDSASSVGSPMFSGELHSQSQSRSSSECVKPSLSPETRSPEPGIPVKRHLPLQVFEFKEGLRSSWKFKETPRLSLDSRAIIDGKGSLYPREIRTNAAILSTNRYEGSAEATMADVNENQRRSPSVIAKLMGLEALPDSGREPLKKAELRRSASESRVSRDLLHYRYIDGNNFQQSNFGSNVSSNVIRDNAALENDRSKVQKPDSKEFCARKPKSEWPKAPTGGIAMAPWKSQQQRRSFFDSQDVFPESKQTGSLYEEIEKRLRMRGIDEPAKDLETLKQILEALQLKGLLHSKKPEVRIGHRNFVYDRRFSSEESPIVVMKPSRSPVSYRQVKSGNDSPPSNFRSKAGVRRNLNLNNETLPPVRPRRDRPEIDRNLQNESRARNSRSPDRKESNAKSPSSLARRKPSNTETQRSSPINSPKLSSKKIGSDPTTSKSPRSRKPSADFSPRERFSCSAEDEASTISESSFSTASQIDTDRSKMENCKEGRSLLERCDSLLHSIAEITSTELQPSPVSVLDSSFYMDESSPSPVMKRSIHFKDQSVELEDENWSPLISPVRSKSQYESDDTDFIYISEILRASESLSEDYDVFLLLEKQNYNRNNSSNVSRLHRKLVFDTITEILDRQKQLPPRKAVTGINYVVGKPLLIQIWSEFQRIRDKDPAENLLEIICGLLRKDMAGDSINGWRNCPVEISETVLDIERMIFKDLVGETIRDLAVFAGKSIVSAPRRKLVF